MHEWLEELRKSSKAAQPGVGADEVRRAETEAGIPFPEPLAQLYQALDGGEFLGDVRLFPLRAAEGQPSVLEKTRLKLVGLPAAGLWRLGLKGQHRHLFAARKSAMREQGDGGPLPGWTEALGDEDWLYGTWDFENRQMKLYRSLPEMLAVLVPPAEEREGFGERTFAQALSAVEGALQQLAVGQQAPGEAPEEAPGEAPEEASGEAAEEEAGPTVREAVEQARPRRKAPVRKAAKKAPAKKAAKRAPARKAARKAPAKKVAKRAAAKKAARKAPAKKAAKKAPAKKAPARKGAKKASAKRRGAARR